MPAQHTSAHPVPSGRRWLPLGVLLLGLAVTATLAAGAYSAKRAERQALLERRAEALRQALTGRIQSYIDTLPGLRVFGVLKTSPNDAEFSQYADAISLQRRFPGLALTFLAERVRQSDRQAFIAQVRGDRSRAPGGHPDFDIRPPGQRPEHMVLRHYHPADPSTFGYDLYDPGQHYRGAIEAAIDSGGYVATGPLRLARDRFQAAQPLLTSVVIRAAIYAGGLTPATTEARREAAQGVTGVAFRTVDLVNSVMPAELRQQLALRITDLNALAQPGATADQATVFDSQWQDPVGATAAAPALLRLTLDVADRRWELALAERTLPLWARLDAVTGLLLLLGSALSLSLAVMTRTLVQGKLRADERVRQATAELVAEQRQLALSEGRFRMLFEHSMDAIFRTRPDGRILAANPAACALFGCSEASLCQLDRRALVDADDPRLTVLSEQRASTGRAAGQLRMRRADGSLFEADLASSTYIDEGGELATSVFVRDVTERQRLAEQQARLTAILDATPDFVGSANPQGLNTFLNRAWRRLRGHADDADLSTLTIHAFHPPWATQRVLDEGIPAAHRDGLWRGETALLAADGSEVPVSQLILCHRNQQGQVTHLSTVAHDLRPLKQSQAEHEALQSRLRDTQRLEAIGTLAGGVAHDFNNVLAAILGNVAMARQDVASEHPVQRPLALVQQAAVRARTLVQQILTFSRRTPQQRRPQPLQALVAEAVALLRATLPSEVRLDTALLPTPLTVLTDGAQMQQVVMNLCTNAWQALPEQQGLITVRVDAVALPAGVAMAETPARTRVARLQVQDSGSGMDAATLAHIFEPFFTTKPVGQGTGLGLAVVHGIVTGSGGAIVVDSQPGQGSCFSVYLPLCAEPAASEPGPELHAVPRGHGERLLYVDDDEVVGLTMQSLLERAGYQVTRLTDGHAAVAAVQADPAGHALLITDFNMPGLSGLAVAKAVRALAPGLPLVITSGFVDEALQLRAQQAGVDAVLLKEHSMERLPALVHALLARRLRPHNAGTALAD